MSTMNAMIVLDVPSYFRQTNSSSVLQQVQRSHQQNVPLKCHQSVWVNGFVDWQIVKSGDFLLPGVLKCMAHFASTSCIDLIPLIV